MATLENQRGVARPIRGNGAGHSQASGGAESRASGSAGEQHFVLTPDGLRISVREWGDPAGREILFIHGVAQSHLSFVRQFDSDLLRGCRLLAYDLRGHGESDKPVDPTYYREGRRWADEVEAVIEGTDLRQPVLVGWSLGGRVLRQYLVHYGDRRLAGIHVVSSRPIEDPSVLAPASRADLAGRPAHLRGRIDANIAFLRACFNRQPDEDEFARALAYNMIVPGEVRDAIAGWETDAETSRMALAAVTVPALISHGLADSLILPSAAKMTAAAIKHARLSWYPDCGHSPFYEDAPRFNRELAEFVASIGERRSASEGLSHGHRA